MKTSQLGKMALVASEGIAITPYKDTEGVWTVGIGVTKSAGDIDPEKNKGKTFDIETLIYMFESRVLPKYEAIINRNVKVKLSQQEFDALVHFVYNIGEPNFKKSKLLQNLNEGKKTEAFSKGFHGWLKQEYLRSRRDKERAIALQGKYGATTATVFGVNSKYQPVAKSKVDLKRYFSNTSDLNLPGSIEVTPTPNTPTATPDQKYGWVKTLINAFVYFFTKRKS